MHRFHIRNFLQPCPRPPYWKGEVALRDLPRPRAATFGVPRSQYAMMLLVVVAVGLFAFLCNDVLIGFAHNGFWSGSTVSGVIYVINKMRYNSDTYCNAYTP